VLSVCVFCGARTGHDPAHADAARAIGTGIARAGWRLIYGAGDTGLMGAVAEAAQTAGGATLGVIPTHLVPRERQSGRSGPGGNGPVIVTETMHERKKVMVMNADGFVVLPGGAGTLDELFEVLTWRQLGLHRKPVVVVNAGGYWDPVVGLLDRVVADGFADPSLREFVTVVPDAPAALDVLGAALGQG
jgi:hypothetical protein